MSIVFDDTTGLHVLASVPGRILDVDATRALYTNAGGLYVRDRATGVDTRAANDVGDGGTDGFTITGAYPDANAVSANGRFDGRYSAPAHPYSGISTDLQTGAEIGCARGMGQANFLGFVGISNAGAPVWQEYATGNKSVILPWVCPADNGTSTPAATNSIGDPVYVSDALLSDTLLVWSTQPSANTLPSINWNDLSPGAAKKFGTVVGAAAIPASFAAGTARQTPAAHRDFDTACGYFSYTGVSGTDIAGFVVSPGGVSEKRSIWTGYSTLAGISPTGEAMVETTAAGAAGRYLTRSGLAPALFSKSGRAKWVDGAWLNLSGNTAAAGRAAAPAAAA